MKEISGQALLAYFSARSNRFYNQEGMLFGVGPVNDNGPILTCVIIIKALLQFILPQNMMNLMNSFLVFN